MQNYSIFLNSPKKNFKKKKAIPMHEVVLMAVSAAVSIETIFHILATCFIITTCQVFFQVMPAT